MRNVICATLMCTSIEVKYISHTCLSCNYVKFLFDDSYEYGLDEKYSDESYLSSDYLRWAHRVILSKNLLNREESILEIGCFNGFFVKALRNEGYDCYGSDIMDSSINYGKDLYGLHAYIKSGPFGRKFNTIIMIDVLEHVKNPVVFLKDLIELYKPEKFLISVPNGDRIFYDKSDWPPHHYSRFSTESLRHLMRLVDYNVTYVEFETSVFLFLRNVLGRILYGYNKKYFTGSKVYALSGKFTGIYLLLDGLLSFPFKVIGLRYASTIVLCQKSM